MQNSAVRNSFDRQCLCALAFLLLSFSAPQTPQTSTWASDPPALRVIKGNESDVSKPIRETVEWGTPCVLTKDKATRFFVWQPEDLKTLTRVGDGSWELIFTAPLRDTRIVIWTMSASDDGLPVLGGYVVDSKRPDDLPPDPKPVPPGPKPVPPEPKPVPPDPEPAPVIPNQWKVGQAVYNACITIPSRAEFAPRIADLWLDVAEAVNPGDPARPARDIDEAMNSLGTRTSEILRTDARIREWAPVGAAVREGLQKALDEKRLSKTDRKQVASVAIEIGTALKLAGKR